MKPTVNASGYQAPAVHRAFDILRVVAASQREMGISDLAKQLGFSKSTTHGLVQALLTVGALDQSQQGKKFFLGPVVVELAFRNWNYFRVVEHSQALLDDLRDRIKETVFLGALSHWRGLIMATAEALKPLKITSPPGTTIPLLAGAVGKVFLAQHDDAHIARLLKERELPQFTSRSIISKKAYLDELSHVRKQGYAMDNEEYLPGVRAVAVGLDNHRGLPLAIWVVGFAESMSDNAIPWIVKETLNAAKKLQQVLDGTPQT
jgi:DNA-binding IclR family transcriptional regulator